MPEYDEERPFINNRDWLATSIRHAHSRGTAIEFEVVHMQVFPNAKLGVLGAGPFQFSLAAVGMAYGCHTVRVGLQDNLFRANGRPAESNHQLIGEMVELAKFFRRTPASPDQAAEILGLRRKVTTSTH